MSRPVVTLLCLDEDGASSTSAILIAFLEALMGQLFAFRVATNPLELASLADDEATTKVLIIDCAAHSVYSISNLINAVRHYCRVGIMVVGHSVQQRREVVAAGADVALRFPMHRRVFEEDLRELLSHYAVPAQTLPGVEPDECQRGRTHGQQSKSHPNGFMAEFARPSSEQNWPSSHKIVSLRSLLPPLDWRCYLFSDEYKAVHVTGGASTRKIDLPEINPSEADEPSPFSQITFNRSTP